MKLCDVNVLIYAHREESSDHEAFADSAVPFPQKANWWQMPGTRPLPLSMAVNGFQRMQTLHDFRI